MPEKWTFRWGWTTLRSSATRRICAFATKGGLALFGTGRLSNSKTSGSCQQKRKGIFVPGGPVNGHCWTHFYPGKKGLAVYKKRQALTSPRAGKTGQALGLVGENISIVRKGTGRMFQVTRAQKRPVVGLYGRQSVILDFPRHLESLLQGRSLWINFPILLPGKVGRLFRAEAKGRTGVRRTLKKTGCRIESGMTTKGLDAGSGPA
jgi:hypothetical protein